MTLLEKVRELQNQEGYRRGIKAKIPYTREEMEVIAAYIRDEITTREYGAALGLKNPGSVTHRIGSAIKFGIKSGWIRFELI